jgi:DNA helicase HerA-like ATPase
MRANPKLDVEKVIGELAVGEALVSFLDEKGQPGIVERAFVLPPKSQIGPVTPDARRQMVSRSVLYGHYEKVIDRESAFERLRARAEKFAQPGQPPPPQPPAPGQASYPGGYPPLPTYPSSQAPRAPRPVGRPRDTLFEAMAKSTMRSIGSSVGRQIVRGVLGSILGGGRR